jgi:hypothetical protein
LGDVEAEFDALVSKELPAVNKSLAQKKLQPIQPIRRKDWDAKNAPTDEAAATPPKTKSFFDRD